MSLTCPSLTFLQSCELIPESGQEQTRAADQEVLLSLEEVVWISASSIQQKMGIWIQFPSGNLPESLF